MDIVIFLWKTIIELIPTIIEEIIKAITASLPLIGTLGSIFVAVMALNGIWNWIVDKLRHP